MDGTTPRLRLARLLSVVGHPGIVAPIVAIARIARRMERVATIGWSVGLLALVAATLLHARAQVARGRWGHIDASRPEERRGLNRLILALLLAAVATALMLGAAGIALGFACGALIVGVALLCTRWLKLSLHVGFAVLAALAGGLIGGWVTVILLVLAAGLGWSRLALGRHDGREVAAGAVAGLVAGAALLIRLRAIGG